MPLPKIIDNNRKIFLNVLKEVLPQYKELSIATGYWDLEGTQLILDQLKDYKKIRLLIGREPLLSRDNKQKVVGPEPDYPDRDFFQDLENVVHSPELKNTVITIKKMIDEGKLEVRVYRKSFLHAKCYIFGGYDSTEAIGVIGSSNFTRNGLTKNTELNALESDQRIVTSVPKNEQQEVGHLFWFDQFWNDETTENWNGKFTEILGESPVGDVLFSPYETYIKTLYEVYKEELEEEELLSTIKGTHELLDFQKKNVQALIRRLNKYRVAMLSDSVGLGKTYTAIEVIKQYFDSADGKRRVVVICPKSLKEQWNKELATQGVLNLSPIVFQNKDAIDRAQELDHIASVSLFVIDESHNLRKTSGKRYEQILTWMRNNPKAHVLLLTATPINNQLTDITSQILLGARGYSDVLKIPSIDSKTKQTTLIDFYQAIENLKKKINQDVARNEKIDYEYIRQTMTPIIRHFVVRRTRQGIEKEYGFLMINGKEARFPKSIPMNQKYDFAPETLGYILAITSDTLPLEKIFTATPESLLADCHDLKHPLDQLDQVKSFRDPEEIKNESPMYFIFQLVLMLGFIPYRWRMYQTKFYGKTLDEVKALRLSAEESKSLQLQVGIYGILRTIFLKRMESSINAVRVSVETYQTKLNFFEKGVKQGKIVSLKDIAALETILADDNEDIEETENDVDEPLEEGVLDEIDNNKYNTEVLLADIQKEKQLIDLLLQYLRIIEVDDSKLKSFAALMETLNNENKAGGKVLIFSYFADTINYLQKNISNFTNLVTNTNTAFVSSKNRGDADTLASCFSPRSKNYEIKEGQNEIKYLFSTDVLSEGQNLQDCGVIVNYDLHWNPVRMIQRNGRVNRLGSMHATVYVYNMSPESRLEGYLRLVERLEGKIELIRNTVGTDQAVLTELPNPIDFTDSLDDIYNGDEQSRIRALEKLESSADFLLSEDEYIFDLKKFHKSENYEDSYKQHIYSIPRGKWGVFPARAHAGSDRPPVLALAGLFNESKSLGIQFVRMERNADKLQAITNLQALEWLRTSPEDNDRSIDNISCDRLLISTKAKQNIATYHGEDEAGAPVGQQAELLRLMYEQQYSIEDIESLQNAFNTKNVIDRSKINQLVRKVMKAKRDNKPHLEELKQLLAISKISTDTVDEVVLPDEVQELLYYVKDNQ